MARRSYEHYCATARALDVVGDRWTLLVARELLLGPRRYTDLHADLPGISTDVLATRLKGLERDGVVTRHRLPPPATATVYELTERGRDLLPALTALARWGATELAERNPTDAVRAHWFAIPLMDQLWRLAGDQEGVVDVALDEGSFHVLLAGDAPSFGDGPATDPDARIAMPADVCLALVQGTITMSEAVRAGKVELTGDSALADTLAGG